MLVCNSATTVAVRAVKNRFASFRRNVSNVFGYGGVVFRCYTTIARIHWKSFETLGLALLLNCYLVKLIRNVEERKEVLCIKNKTSLFVDKHLPDTSLESWRSSFCAARLCQFQMFVKRCGDDKSTILTWMSVERLTGMWREAGPGISPRQTDSLLRAAVSVSWQNRNDSINTAKFCTFLQTFTWACV